MRKWREKEVLLFVRKNLSVDEMTWFLKTFALAWLRQLRGYWPECSPEMFLSCAQRTAGISTRILSFALLISTQSSPVQEVASRLYGWEIWQVWKFFSWKTKGGLEWLTCHDHRQSWPLKPRTQREGDSKPAIMVTCLSSPTRQTAFEWYLPTLSPCIVQRRHLIRILWMLAQSTLLVVWS